MNRMHSPPHPGEILKEDVLPDLGLTVTDAAEQLGVARVTLSRMINGHAAISADMATGYPSGWAEVPKPGCVPSPSTTYGTQRRDGRSGSSPRNAKRF